MKGAGIHAYVISDVDPHQSEYVSERWKTRSWFSGFHGSAGTVVVTADTVGLWTDSRYYLEAEEALSGTAITLFRDGSPGVPSYAEWIAAHLEAGQHVGVDDEVFSVTLYRALASACAKRGVAIRPGVELFAEIWDDRPAAPLDPIFIHDSRFTGRSRVEKIADLRRAMAGKGIGTCVFPALDDVAWLLNIRGTDIEYNPVALCYAAVTARAVVLFIHPSKVPDLVRSALVADGIELRNYDQVESFVQSLEGGTLALAPDKTSFKLLSRVPERVRVLEETSLVTTLKGRKSLVEQDHLRDTMIRDGVAMERFLHWIEGHAATDRITELSASRKLAEFRAKDERFVGESFETIAGFGAHGAIIHYGPTEKSDVQILAEGMLLLDSGGQYLDGTTDITRVVALGTPAKQAVRDYTMVLKAHIALATIHFPEGTAGHQLDSVARSVLWREGLSYAHGTGHGVGYFLNVHEGPQRIGSQPQSVPLEIGMYTSNEPGVYRAGEYGIRIENLMLVQEAEMTDFGRFFQFETITLCHLEPSLIDAEILSDRECAWVNAYQAQVYEKIGPLLDDAEREWLRRKTEPL